MVLSRTPALQPKFPTLNGTKSHLWCEAACFHSWRSSHRHQLPASPLMQESARWQHSVQTSIAIAGLVGRQPISELTQQTLLPICKKLVLLLLLLLSLSLLLLSLLLLLLLLLLLARPLLLFNQPLQAAPQFRRSIGGAAERRGAGRCRQEAGSSCFPEGAQDPHHRRLRRLLQLGRGVGPAPTDCTCAAPWQQFSHAVALTTRLQPAMAAFKNSAPWQPGMHTTAQNRTAVAAAAAAAAAPLRQRCSGLQRGHRGQQHLQDGGQPRVGQLCDAIPVLLQVPGFLA